MKQKTMSMMAFIYITGKMYKCILSIVNCVHNSLMGMGRSQHRASAIPVRPKTLWIIQSAHKCRGGFNGEIQTKA